MSWFRRLSLAVAVATAIGLSWAAAGMAAPVQGGGEAVRVVPEYRLGPGDKLRIVTYGADSLSGEFLVGSSGKVSFPLVGDLPAVDLTVPEFQKEVEAALLDGYLKQPRVSVEVLNYRPFYILGEVNRPGEYPYSYGLTVLNAVATANGFTYRANTKRVFIKRSNSADEQVFPLTGAIQVAPGDTIRVGERYF